jgi:hypothetical protein
VFRMRITYLPFSSPPLIFLDPNDPRHRVTKLCYSWLSWNRPCGDARSEVVWPGCQRVAGHEAGRESRTVDCWMNPDPYTPAIPRRRASKITSLMGRDTWKLSLLH